MGSIDLAAWAVAYPRERVGPSCSEDARIHAVVSEGLLSCESQE